MADDSKASNVGGRYAQALFDLASENKQIPAVEADLKSLKTALAESKDLRVLVGSPAFGAADKGKGLAAIALSPAQAKGVAAALRQALGKDPEIETRVDPAILGGIKVRVGSRLFDASLKSKLDSLKFALKRA